MNTKKVTTFSLFAVLLLSTLFFTSLASAGVGQDIASGLESGIEEVKPVVQFLLGGETLTGEMIFIKLLMFLLLFAILIRVTREVPVLEGRAVSIIVSITITILAVRFLGTEALIEFMWLPQGVLGVVLIAMIPPLIFFYLMKEFDEGIITKVGWSAFTVIYAALAFTRWDKLAFGAKEWWQNYAWVYLIIAILSGFMVLAQKGITRYKEAQGRKLNRKDKLEIQLAEFEKDLTEAEDALSQMPDSKRRKGIVRRLEKKIEAQKRIIKKIK